MSADTETAVSEIVRSSRVVACVIMMGLITSSCGPAISGSRPSSRADRLGRDDAAAATGSDDYVASCTRPGRHNREATSTPARRSRKVNGSAFGIGPRGREARSKPGSVREDNKCQTSRPRMVKRNLGALPQRNY